MMVFVMKLKVVTVVIVMENKITVKMHMLVVQPQEFVVIGSEMEFVLKFVVL